MGIFNKIFAKKNQAVQKTAMDVNAAVEAEKSFLTTLIAQESLKGNHEVDCMAQVLIRETDFLVQSDRIPRKQS